MTEEINDRPAGLADQWHALQNLILRSSLPARRVLLAALKNHLGRREGEPSSDYCFCGSCAEEYGKLFHVDPEEAVRQIRQGCADILDTLLAYAAPGSPDEEIRSLVACECTFAGSGAGLRFRFHLAPAIARSARPLAAALSVEEVKAASAASEP